MKYLPLHKPFTYICICFFLLPVTLINAKLYASEIDSLYEATILVETDEGESKDPAVKQKQLLDKAFLKVIYKVTGSKNFLNSPNLKDIMQNSESLVQKFSFQKKEHSTQQTNETQNTSELASTFDATKLEKEKQEWFWARFNKRATDQLLKKYQLPIWESQRPDTLIWLSIEKDRQREIMSLSTASSIAEVLTNTSKQRGIKLIYPFADLQDREKLSSSDLWGNYSQAIKAASIRYNSQAIVAVRIHQDPSGLWISKWTLYVLDKVRNWDTKNEDLSLLLSQGINRLADKLAELFAINSDSLNKNSSIIQINNVTNFKGFLDTINYFKQVSVIQSSNLIQVKGDSLSFKVYYLGDKKHLSQSLVLGGILQKVENSEQSLNQQDTTKSSEYVSVILDTPTDQEKGTQTANTKSTMPKVQINEPIMKSTQIKLENSQPDLEFWLAQ